MAEVTKDGVIQKSATEYIQDCQDFFVSVFGESINKGANTPQGQLAGLLGLMAAKFDQGFADAMRSLDIAQAQGQQLDDLTSILSIFRRGAAKSSVNATISGTPLAVIPAGSQAKTTVGDIFVLQYTVQIGEDGTAEGFFVAKDDGPKAISAGTLTQIAVTVSGWDTVTNVNAGTIGRDVETDYQFKRRYFTELAVSSVSQIQSIISGVQSASDVEAVEGLENDTSEVVEESGIRIPPNGFVVAVKGGDSLEIATKIRKHKGLGTCSRTHVEADMTGTAGTVIPKGTRARVLAEDNPAGIDIFLSLKSQVTLDGLGNGTGYFLCDTEGDIEFDEAMMTTIVDEIDGFDTVSNVNSERFVTRIVDVMSGSFVRQRIKIDFKRVQPVPITISISLEKNSKFPLNGEELIRQNIVNYMNGSDPFTTYFDLDGLSVGEMVYKSRLYTPVNMVIGHRVNYIHLNGKELEDQDFIDIFLDEQAVISNPETDIVFE
jgi:uncharacterized phage protein gp47/JayE